jgi:hypothetical protein
MKITTILTVVVSLMLCACARCTSQEASNPKWVDALIVKSESDPVANPPLSIWRYEYGGQVVYYVPPQCCDIPSSLYDADGNLLCHPDGGFTGGGDGQCRDFSEERTSPQLVWQDKRTYP